MKMNLLVYIGLILMPICIAQGALLVNGDMSANSYAISSDNNHVEFQSIDQGWAVKSQSGLDFDANPGEITWEGPDKSLLEDGLAQIVSVGNATGNVLTLAFDWTAAVGATSTNVSLEYQVLAWTTNATPAATDVLFNYINGDNKKASAVGSGSVYDLLNNGAESTGTTTLSFDTFDGAAGSNISASIALDLSDDTLTDISAYDFVGVRFHLAGDNSDLTAIGSTLDNVQLVASKEVWAIDDERNFYTDYIDQVSATVDLLADYGVAWDAVNGANATDTNDDSAALQAAIDDMTALTNGGVVTIPAGTFYLNAVALKSNVHIVVDPDATLVASSEGIMFKFGLASKRVDALTTISNVSIRGDGGRYTVDGSWIAPSNKFALAICNNVDNFMIADFNVLDNYTVFSAVMTSMAEHEDSYFVARNGVVKNGHNDNAHFGYGTIQAWAGHNLLFKDLSGEGGITFRCETGLNSLMTAPAYVNLDKAYGRNISVTNGHGAVMMGAHGRPNGLVDVDGVVAVSSLFAVSVGDGYGSSGEDVTITDYGFDPESRIRNVHAVFGTNAQLKSKNFKEVPCPLKYLIAVTAFEHDPIIFQGPAAYVTKSLDPSITISNVTAEGFEYVPYLMYGDVPYKTLSSAPAEPVVGITVSPASMSLQVAQTAQVTGVVIPFSATVQGINWSTSDSSVATVSESGQIMAVGPGTCDVIGNSVDWGWPGTCTVTVAGGGGGSWTEFSNNDFESDWGAWQSGGANAFLTNYTYAIIESQYVRLQDNTATSHMVLSNALDLSSYQYLKIEFSLIADNVDDGEELVVECSPDGGESWSTAKAYKYDYEFDDERRADLKLVLDADRFNFTSNVNVRIRSNASGLSAVFYIGEVVISGFAQSGWGNAVAAYGLSGVATHDSDQDGQTDLYEYAFGGNPTNASIQATSPYLTYDSDSVRLFTQECSASNPGVTYTAEWTDDLVSGTWTHAWESETSGGSENSAYKEMQRTLSGGTNDQMFLRVKLVQP